MTDPFGHLSGPAASRSATDGPPPPPDLGAIVDRAAQELAAVASHRWDELRGGVFAAVRAASRPGWPVRAAMSDLDPDRDPRERTQVSESVLRDQLSRAVSEQHPCALAAVALELDGDGLRGIVVQIVARHGDDLRALGEQVRGTVSAVLGELLGPPGGHGATGRVDVTVADIAQGDPRLV